MTDGLDWRVAIVGYDRIQWARYLNDYARQSGEPEPSTDDGRRETHFAQYIGNEGELRRSFYQAILKIEWLPSKIRQRGHVGARPFAAKAEERCRRGPDDHSLELAQSTSAKRG